MITVCMDCGATQEMQMRVKEDEVKRWWAQAHSEHLQLHKWVKKTLDAACVATKRTNART